MGTKIMWSGVLSIVSALLVGCSSQTPDTTSADRSSDTASTEAKSASAGKGETANGVELDPGELIDFFSFQHARYVEFPQTEDLAGEPFTDLGVAGTVRNFSMGPKLFADGGENSGKTVLMHVEVNEVIAGSGRPEIVDVALLSADGQNPSDFSRVLPHGTEVVLYLSQGSDALANGDLVYVPATPQGFVVQASANEPGVVYPLAHEMSESETLSDQKP